MPRSTSVVRRPRADMTTREIIEMAGGREALEEALELVGADPQGQHPVDALLARLRDPTYADHSPTQLAASVGISRAQIHDLLGKRDVAIAVFMSRRKHLADVLDDIGEDAKTRIVTCRNCGGAGWTLGPLATDQDRKDAAALRLTGVDLEFDDALKADCDDCDGTGVLRKLGDPDSRKLFLKVHGFDKSAGGAPPIGNLQIGVQVNNPMQGKQSEPITVKVERLLGGD